MPLKEYFKKLKIVPISISYENDPTDMLKMPELLAKAREETYVKQKNEDFRTLMSGIMGQKKADPYFLSGNYRIKKLSPYSLRKIRSTSNSNCWWRNWIRK